MLSIFNKLKIKFDDKGFTTISKETLYKLIRSTNFFIKDEITVPEFYLLVDSNGSDFYPFALSDLPQWEKDGSLEPGDSLYHVKYVKTIK